MKTPLFRLLAGVALGLSQSAAAATYNCLPIELRDEGSRFEVLCAEPSPFEGGYPKDGADQIRSFAVAASDADFAKRFVHIVQTALTAGMIVQLQYTTGDTSGTAFGCASISCRKPWAVGLLAPATNVRIPYAVWPSAATESLAQGQWRIFGPFSISYLRKLVVTLTGTGNADLYVRKDDPPTDTAFNCRPLLAGSNESCTIQGPVKDPNSPKGETYYVGVKGSGPANTFKLSVEIQNK